MPDGISTTLGYDAPESYTADTGARILLVRKAQLALILAAAKPRVDER